MKMVASLGFALVGIMRGLAETSGKRRRRRKYCERVTATAGFSANFLNGTR
jgi:hypothetical protein